MGNKKVGRDHLNAYVMEMLIIWEKVLKVKWKTSILGYNLDGFEREHTILWNLICYSLNRDNIKLFNTDWIMINKKRFVSRIRFNIVHVKFRSFKAYINNSKPKTYIFETKIIFNSFINTLEEPMTKLFKLYNHLQYKVLRN